MAVHPRISQGRIAVSDAKTLERTASAPSITEAREGGDRGLPISLAALGIALLSTSCCILPLVLVLMGLGGVWVGSLTALAIYKPWIIGLSAVMLALGFRHAYRRRPTCDGASCSPRRVRLTRALLWASAVVVLASATSGWWIPWLLD